MAKLKVLKRAVNFFRSFKRSKLKRKLKGGLATRVRRQKTEE